MWRSEGRSTPALLLLSQELEHLERCLRLPSCADFFVRPAHRAEIAPCARAVALLLDDRGGREEALRQGVPDGLGDGACRRARLVVQRDGDLLEAARGGAVVEDAFLDRRAREETLEGQRIEDRLQDLTAADDAVLLRADLSGLVVRRA